MCLVLGDPPCPKTSKIPSPKSNRLPSNIPLRTLTNRSDHDHGAQSTSLLAGHHRDQPSHERRSDDSADSDSWTDTGDLAEQLADEEDPLRKTIADTSINDDLLSGVLKRHPKHKRVQFRRSVSEHSNHRSSRSFSTTIDKEAIQVPNVSPRRIGRAERFIAAIMPGAGVHGFTGKALIYFTSIFVSLGVFLFGYDQGVMSGIITGPYFRDYFKNPSKAEIGTMVAILEIGALVSSLIVGRVGDIIGRRRTILYGSIIFFVGGALQTFAANMPMMMLGRVIAGLGVGSLSTIVPVYQSEISPPHNRGKLACIEFSGNIIGYTTSVWVDYFCGYIESDLSWRIPLLMQCVMGALLGLGSLIIVESPRWLLDNDHDEEGIVVIANLYGGGDIHNAKAREEYREIKMNVLLQRMEGERTYSEMFRRYKTRVFIAMSAQALAQLNGINVISYYAPYVFESAGWIGHDAVKMTGINGITYLLSTIPPWYVVDRWGRRVILLTGAVAMAISLSMVSYFIYLDIKSTPTLVVIFVMIYNAAFGYSWGPIPWLYPPEILPLSIRSKGASLSTASNWAFNWLVGEMTPILQEWIKWRLYLVHAFFCVVSFVVVYFIYPETCGVRLEDMDSLFGDASTAVGTPGVRSETGSLVRAGSPVPSLDLRGRPLGPDANIPPMDIDPPVLNIIDGKPQLRSESQSSRGRVGEWLTRMVGQNRGTSSSPAAGARYAPLDQRDD
ncbi:sugar transporter-domain-containing protein [Annulohypoxylon maeteangense]|uniref:sugar transporter-domain-containing protein n=1 Tax=Annulohypoxylon maeteangense TaxID=1927788 RepID=UPI0020086418|nr:sugar transporter-domain-containing protein [Annulohypoxylon maeteangense]KAI0882436.1 sugar transporter-domain-containing protein [Annulohypoxylon maeteangense]